MRTYDENKICFIICTNDKQYLEECLLYLSLLNIPEGFETELLTIEGAKSMTSGYNEAMFASNAKYKIYLHQDSFVTNCDMLTELIELFKSDSNIGLVGTIGSEKLSKDAVMWHGKRCGNFYRLDEINKHIEEKIEIISEKYREVDVVDGLFIATQYDITWREDILDGWDFYDVSQCMEFRRAGYKVVIPKQSPECINHVCGAPGFWNYNRYREVIVKEYPEIWEGRKEIRIYFVRSKEIGLLGLPYCLQEMGHEVTLSDPNIPITVYSEDIVEYIEEVLEEGNFDLVMSYDFVATAAVACNHRNLKYWAWVYDSPLMSLYMKEARLPNVYISVFDKKQLERLQPLGFKHIFHLPLATEVDYFGCVNISKEDERKYEADIAFVGRLYDKRGYEELFEGADKEIKEEADAIVNSCQCIWDGENNIFDRASDNLIQYIVEKESEDTWNNYNINKRYYCESIKLVRKCNENERVRILNALAKKHKVTLYSDEGSKERLQNVKVCPWVDYWKEMPKVFYMSKINLNISSRSIESGIPQRVFDIMAVGGFCLTNYQPELEEHFEIGKDLDVYHNLGELEEKVEYYLTHNEARVRIAVNGYKKVRKNHNYQVRLEKVIDWILKES